MTKDVISLSISVLLLFRHYISHKITFGAPSSGGVLCSACGAFIEKETPNKKIVSLSPTVLGHLAEILPSACPRSAGLLAGICGGMTSAY